ncbi:replication-associated recombination protein A [candidate division WWE3 bacterium]|nr:replication-associated recombination protein A [candidate division WWE3 bacterium]
MQNKFDAPLAERMRPRTLDEVVGQGHLIGEKRILRQIVEQDQIPSIIFWGPPGSGKTTIAKTLAHTGNYDFIQISAIENGVKDIRLIVGQAKQIRKDLNKKTLLFIDEIHRFNKNQQDALLPHVENGTLTLVGATTENPSFEVNPALLSRCRVLVLKPLADSDISTLIELALHDKDRGYGNRRIMLDFDRAIIPQLCHGDARSALNLLETAIAITPEIDDTQTVTKEILLEAVQQTTLKYDKNGEEHYNTVSAFIKSMRASQPDAALYYLARMVDAGEDPLFIARRMVIFASEDIGIAQPTALVVANEVFKACEVIGYPECQINLAHGVTYLSLCKKNRSAYDAYFKAVDDVKKYGNLPIPLHLRNAPTKLMKDIGYGKGYAMYDEKSYLPDDLIDKKYFPDSKE